MCAVILSSEERKRLSKANAVRYKEYLEWISRLPEPFKTFYETRFLWAWLVGPLFLLFIAECGQPPKKPVEKINPYSNTSGAIEQTRPSEPRTALPQQRPSARP